MTRSVEKFAELLSEGVHRIRLRESKKIQIIQDELGYALDREGGSAIEYWRKGHIPPNLTDVETLARHIVRRGGLERPWLEAFLHCADHPYPAILCDEIYPAPASNGATPLVAAKPCPIPKNLGETKCVSQAEFGLDCDTFTVGPPILHPRYFFGRTYELRRIFGLWKRSPLQHIAIIGLRFSGKTSLLHYLSRITTTEPKQLRPNQQHYWLDNPQRYRWVFVDFRDARMGQRARLLRHILTCLKMPIPAQCNLENFIDVVSMKLKQPTIILMDEISLAIEAPELDLSFWGSLRSLASNLTEGLLAFVVTAHDSPTLLAHQQGKPSPFFNIFGHTFTLGPLNNDEARQLLASSPRPFDEKDVEWILAQSQGWPRSLQALAHARLVALEDRERGEAWKQDGLRRMRPVY